RQSLDRRANRLAAYLKRIARQPHVANWTFAAELHRAGRAPVLEYPAGAPRAVEAGERENLAGHKAFGLAGIHEVTGHCRCGDRTCKQDSRHETRKHTATPKP